jgi:hypothetical protein
MSDRSRSAVLSRHVPSCDACARAPASHDNPARAVFTSWLLYRGGVREALAAADEIDDLLHNAKLVPMTGDVRLDVEPYLAGVAKMRAACGWIVARERGSAHTPVADLLDALERLGTDSKKIPMSSQRRVSKEDVYGLLDGFRAVVTPLIAQRHRDEELNWNAEVVDLGASGAPTLETLLDRVASGERLLLARSGRLIADLRPPPPQP